MIGFIDRWTKHENDAELSNLCLGIDPSQRLLGEWGLSEDADGAREFGMTCVRAVRGAVSTVKFQIAYFEQFGSRGIDALEQVLEAARDAGLMTVVDAKRNDIDSTVAAYARAYFGPESPLRTDAITANPYMGVDALGPMLDAAAETGGTVFVLVRTSNVSQGTSLQGQTLADGRTVAQVVADDIARINRTYGPLPVIGAVIGATVGNEATELAERLEGAPVLAPGVGAQGASLASTLAVFPAGTPLIIPVSRAVLSAGPAPDAVRNALAALVRGDA
jgi:orotidine-5'-phosphate decarboxylase